MKSQPPNLISKGLRLRTVLQTSWIPSVLTRSLGIKNQIGA